MKIKHIETPAEFQPYSVCITFETQKEKDDIQAMIEKYIKDNHA